MKRNAELCTIVLASVILLDGSDTPKKMTGWICTSACVAKNAATPLATLAAPAEIKQGSGLRR
jgi:hypothetical protein